MMYHSVLCSHERVLEAITEEAERLDIERFQPLLAGMKNHNIALKVHMKTYFNNYFSPCVLLLTNDTNPVAFDSQHNSV